MNKMKRIFSSFFKTKVVLELLSDEKTIAQIANKYKITSKSLIDRKRWLFVNTPKAFDVGKAVQNFNDEINVLKKNDALDKK